MALTLENIAETWGMGGTVQVATPEDWNTLIIYLKANLSADSMRYAEIVNDLDFIAKEVEDCSLGTNKFISNFSLDGKNHTIKNIVLYSPESFNFLNIYNSSTVNSIKNLIIDNCKINVSSTFYFIRANTIFNVIIKNCIIESSHVYLFYGHLKIMYCSSNNEIISTNTSSSSHIFFIYQNNLLINNISKNIITTYGSLSEFYTGGSGYCYNCISRSKIILKNTSSKNIIPFDHFGSFVNSYAANDIEDNGNEYVYKPFNGSTSSATNTHSYYDKTLIPDDNVDSTSLQYGLTTEELQSVATMTEKGWHIKEVE